MPFCRSAVCLFGACFLIAGCNKGDRPDIGEVHGTITVDGQPASNVIVAFTQPGFRASRGFTNQDGQYELKYVKDVDGAVLGEHSVKLRYYGAEEGPKREQLPAKYNTDSELTAIVEPGRNQIDFSLETKPGQ